MNGLFVGFSVIPVLVRGFDFEGKTPNKKR
jgi:hypothetical protein